MQTNKIKRFTREALGTLRVVTDEKGESWFVAKDVARALGFKSPMNALVDCVDERNTRRILLVNAKGDTKPTILINKSGLCGLIEVSPLLNTCIDKVVNNDQTYSINIFINSKANYHDNIF